MASTVGQDQHSLVLNFQCSVEWDAFTSLHRKVCNFKNKISLSNEARFVTGRVIAVMKRAVRDSFLV